ncbi:MAG TPA: hypothetical protein DG754_03260 [Bacteroidales bacterium]|nr:hypothetical protein [Bacteroidales bacterium]
MLIGFSREEFSDKFLITLKLQFSMFKKCCYTIRQLTNSSGRTLKLIKKNKRPKLIKLHKDAMNYHLTNLTKLLSDKITKINENKRIPDS